MLLSSPSLQNSPSETNFCIKVEVQLPYFPIGVTIFPQPVWKVHSLPTALPPLLCIKHPQTSSGLSVLLLLCSLPLTSASSLAMILQCLTTKSLLKFQYLVRSYPLFILPWKCLRCLLTFCFCQTHFQVKCVRFLQKNPVFPLYFTLVFRNVDPSFIHYKGKCCFKILLFQACVSGRYVRIHVYVLGQASLSERKTLPQVIQKVTQALVPPQASPFPFGVYFLTD